MSLHNISVVLSTLYPSSERLGTCWQKLDANGFQDLSALILTQKRLLVWCLGWR